MEQILEFIGNHPILTGLFAVVLAAWIAWEVARLMRKWREIDSREAVRLINRDDALVLDVSNSAEHAAGHIIGAMHMPPSRIEAGNKTLLKHKDDALLVYCKNGQISPQMANRLVGLGFTNVHVLAGGLAQWVSDQQPVSRHKSKSKSAGKKKDSAGKKKDRSKPEQDDQVEQK